MTFWHHAREILDELDEPAADQILAQLRAVVGASDRGTPPTG
jgi:hypothetical protein